MVVTKFDEDDWGDSSKNIEFDAVNSLEELKCTADGELPLLRKKNEKKDAEDKEKKLINKRNNHTNKKSLIRLEKFRKNQTVKTVEMKSQAKRNKYKANEENSKTNDDNINENNEENNMQTNEVEFNSIKKINKKRKNSSTNDEDNNKKMKTVEDNENNETEIKKNKKKRKKPARNNKFKPKPEKNEDKTTICIDNNEENKTDDSVKSSSKKKKQMIIKTKVLDDDMIEKTKAKKMKNKLKKLKKKEEKKLLAESKINKQEFLERIVDENSEDEITLEKGSKKLDSKRLKEMVNATDIKKDVKVEKKTKKKEEVKSLKERMEERLDAAHFRHLNEQLYKQSSDQSFEMFSSEPGTYESYHRGYTSQVERWPVNPVDRAITYIKNRRSELIIADLGCGDAKVAASVKNVVYSFDLMASNARVQVCNISQVPLLDKNIDIAVFCLSLMGTDFVSFLVEANRILKVGGTLIIAEVVSRFEEVSTFIRQLEKLGFTLKKKDDKNTMFIWFEFLKTMDTPSGKTPELILNPCVYKKR